MADLLAGMHPLDVLQEMVRREGALYRLQALRSAASTTVTASALDSAGELGVCTHHLRSLSFGYMGLERDLAEARLRVGQLEAREANWEARDAQWVNIVTDRLHAIVGLQEQREQQREQMEQLKDERFVHLQALIDMDGQLEAMDQDLEAANELIQVLQQSVPRPSSGAM
jgi:chromosome segregation ATPase